MRGVSDLSVKPRRQQANGGENRFKFSCRVIALTYISMALRYRNHLIVPKATFDFQLGHWNVGAHVQFKEKGTLKDVLIPCATHSFPNEKAARKHILRKAKNWINANRLDGGKSAGPVLVYTRSEHGDHKG